MIGLNDQKVFAIKIHTLGGGEPILVGMMEREARDLITRHKNGTLDEVIGDTGAALPWTVRSSDIKAIQAFPVDQQQSPKPPSWGNLGSGVN